MVMPQQPDQRDLAEYLSQINEPDSSGLEDDRFDIIDTPGGRRLAPSQQLQDTPNIGFQAVIPISASDILPYPWAEQHIEAKRWVNPNPPPGKLGWATGEDWMIEKDEQDEPVLHIPEKFISAVEHVYGSLDGHQWFKTSSMTVLLALLIQRDWPEETIRDAWSQIFFKFFPSGGVIQVRPEIAIPTLVAGVREQEFLKHPLTKTQTSGGDSSDLDQETESERIGYVRPNLVLCTIDTAYLDELGAVSRAIAFWEVKKGDAHMKGFLQAVWSLLVGWTLFGTEFSGSGRIYEDPNRLGRQDRGRRTVSRHRPLRRRYETDWVDDRRLYGAGQAQLQICICAQVGGKCWLKGVCPILPRYR